MKGHALLNRFLLMKPTLRVVIEFSIILIIGLLGEIFSWIRMPFSPYTNLLGGVLLFGSWIFHAYCHRIHKQAHQESQQIEELVTKGVYSKIRHPMYLSLIVMYLGVAIAWGVVWMLIPALFFSTLTVLIAIKEEGFLLQKFGLQYERYMQEVP